MPRFVVFAIAILGLQGDDPPAPKLAMSPAVVCAKITGYGDYVALEEVVLTRDDKLLIYYEPTGFATEKVGKEHRVHLIQDGRIRRRGEKKVLQSKDKLLDYKGKSSTPVRVVYLANTIALKDLPPGEYDLEIILRDEIAKGKPTSQIVKFRVKPGTTAEPPKG